MNSDIGKSVGERLNSLTKPPGSLGVLESLVLRLAHIREEVMPSVDRKGLFIFCADHGICAEGISPYPASVTREMVRNFVRGGAAINVLCRREGIESTVIDVGVTGDPVEGVWNRRVASGTRSFAKEPAMSRAEAEAALEVGRATAEWAEQRFDIVGLGEMGIGNTTSAAAILSAFSELDPSETAGAGAGSDPVRVRRKADVIRTALQMHQHEASDGMGILAKFGGFEIGAIAGFLLRASELRLPVVLDGFPCCAGALVASRISSRSLDSAFFAHLSSEHAHGTMLAMLKATPLLNLGMRLGEGTGAALAMGLIDSAVCLYREMATFSEAEVSGSLPTGI